MQNMDGKEEWRDRLIDRNLPFFETDGKIKYYKFDHEFINYGISLTGDVKGKTILIPVPAVNGDMSVVLRRNNDIIDKERTKKFYIKDIMANTFLSKDPLKPLVLLRDGNKSNLHISNIYRAAPVIENPHGLYRQEEQIIPDVDFRRLKPEGFRFFDENRFEQFYQISHDFPKHGISLFGRVLGPRGIIGSKNIRDGVSRGMVVNLSYIDPKTNVDNSLHKQVELIMADRFLLKDDPRKTKLIFKDGNRENPHIANIFLVDPQDHIINPEELIGMKRLILSEEFKRRLINPELPVYDENDQVIFYDFMDENNTPTGYKVSMTGRVLGPTGIILSNKPSSGGYTDYDLVIGKTGFRKHYSGYSIVGKTFIRNDDPINKNQWNHIDWDRANDYADNLEPLTCSENNFKKGPNNGCNRAIVQVDSLGEVIDRWNKIIDFASQFKVHINDVKRHCQNFLPLKEMHIRYEKTKNNNIDRQFKSYVFSELWIPIVQITHDGKSIYWSNICEAAIGISGIGDRKINGARIKRGIDNGEVMFDCTWRIATKLEIALAIGRTPPSSEKYGNWKRLFINHMSILVSDLGYVVTNTGKAILGYLNSRGYLRVSYFGKEYLVHRLVIHAFLPDGYSEDKFVDHINEIKTFNALINLRYATAKENSTYANGIPVVGYRSNGEKIGPFLSATAGAEFLGGNKSHCDDILRAMRTGGTSLGCTWELHRE